MPAQPLRVAIVGAGLTGLRVASLLRAHLPPDAFTLTLIDKGAHPGGRMATRQGHDGQPTFEHGLQLLERSSRSAPLLDRWLEASLIAPWPARVRGPSPWREPTYTATTSLRDLAYALLQDASPALHLQRARVVALERDRDAQTWRLRLERPELAAAATLPDVYDHVLVTAPLPQSAALVAPHSPALSASLASAPPMTPCWAVMVNLTRPLDLGADVILGQPSSPLAWAALEDSKPSSPGGPLPCGTRWTLLSSPRFALDHLEDSPEDVAASLLHHLSPNASWVHLRAHRWRFARASPARSDQPPSLSDLPLGLHVAADWLGGGDLDGALRSAEHVAHTLLLASAAR